MQAGLTSPTSMIVKFTEDVDTNPGLSSTCEYMYKAKQGTFDANIAMRSSIKLGSTMERSNFLTLMFVYDFKSI